MSEPDRTPEQERAAKAVRDLPRAEADPRFRETLRRSFVTGAIDSGAAAEPVVELVPRRPVWQLWTGVAAAAAVLAVALVALNRGPAWEVVANSGAGSVVVDGENVPMADLPQGSRIPGGTDVRLSADAGLVLRLPNTALVELTGGTEGVVPGSPGRWWGRTVTGRVDFGELRFQSGPNFPGDRIHLSTPEGEAEIRGTLVPDQRDTTGTCVCVLEGTVWVGTSTRDMEAIHPGLRKVMPVGQAAFVDDMKPMHRDGVQQFSSRYGAQLAP